MSHQSYTALLSGVVNGLKDDTRLSAITDEFIYYGPEGNIPAYPAVTVELREADEVWKTFGGTSGGGGKDVEATFVVRIFDEAYDYVSGLQSIEGHAKNVSDILQAQIGFSGQVYQSLVGHKTFGVYEFEGTPIFGCEIELLTKSRFAPASR